MIALDSSTGIVLFTGSLVFSATFFVLLGTGLYIWVRLNRPNPMHLALAANIALFMLYWPMWGVDWSQGFVQRHDGVEAPWIRGLANAVIMVCNAMIVSAGVWLGQTAASFVMLGAITAGVGLGLADCTADGIFWPWWGVSVAVILVMNAWFFRMAKNASWQAWYTWLGSMVFSVGIPVIQAMSWTMGEVLDTHPARLNSEIAYLVLYFVGVPVFGWIATMVYLPPAKPHLE